MKNTELLSPAGDFECFQSALKFGADAIYPVSYTHLVFKLFSITFHLCTS